MSSSFSALEFESRTIDDTEDYATWVINSIGCRTKLKDPSQRLCGLEEKETMVPTAHHGAEWLLLASSAYLASVDKLRKRAS
jgi:hypothetical protein